MTKPQNNHSERGQKAHRRGHLSEYIALIHLMIKGYRILGFRLKTPEAEIDILATKNKRLAVIEVKQRRTHDEALFSVSQTQRHRLLQAGLKLQARRPSLKNLALNIDLYIVTPRGVKHHIDAFHEEV
jgi:putative endonuclease